jgi:hypothetical protein
MLTRSFAVATLLAAWLIAFSPEAQAQFETRAAFPITNEAPYSVVVGDFNRDGILDLAELNFLPTGSVEILLGNGDGTFRPGDTYAVAGAPFYAASASLRRDGILDLVIAGGGVDDVYVLLGNGDGTFQAPAPYATTAGPKMLALGDFTGGGSIDIVVLEGTSTEGIICDCIEVLPGNGDGTFGAPISTTPVPYNVTGFAIAAGDFNDDGKLDVAVSGGYFSAYQVDILLGNGDDTFTADGYYPVVADPDPIAVGYFTSDKTRLDLAVAGSVGSSVSVLLGNGDGTFQQSVYYPTWFPTWVIAQDLDGDGNIDLATSNAGLPGFTKEYPPGVTVLKGNGDGTFEPGVFYRSGNKSGVNYVAAGDFNGDHRPDPGAGRRERSGHHAAQHGRGYFLAHHASGFRYTSRRNHQHSADRHTHEHGHETIGDFVDQGQPRFCGEVVVRREGCTRSKLHHQRMVLTCETGYQARRDRGHRQRLVEAAGD